MKFSVDDPVTHKCAEHSRKTENILLKPPRDLLLTYYLKRLEKTQNVLKCSILEHFLNWKSITRVNKSKTPFFPISPCNRNPPGFFEILQRSIRNWSIRKITNVLTDNRTSDLDERFSPERG